MVSVTISEIRSGRHFFFQQFGSEAAKVIDESMKLFTKTNGLSGGPCDVSRGKVVAALFNDGSGKTWYRAKIMERKVGPRLIFRDTPHKSHPYPNSYKRQGRYYQ